jgi:hypothetical protein
VRSHIIRLRWMLKCVGLALDVLTMPPKLLERHTLRFLRIHTPYGKPKARMPTWRWLCAIAGHDAKEPLLGESHRLRQLVRKGVLSVAASWIERFATLADGACDRVRREEQRQLRLRQVKQAAPSLIWHVPSLIWHAPSLIWRAPSLIWRAPSLIWHAPSPIWHTPCLIWQAKQEEPAQICSEQATASYLEALLLELQV